MLDEEMIERVSSAIEAAIDKLNDPVNYSGFSDEFAIAAIKAMREPTEKMIDAGKNNYQHGSAIAYQAMIDAVINE